MSEPMVHCQQRSPACTQYDDSGNYSGGCPHARPHRAQAPGDLPPTTIRNGDCCTAWGNCYKINRKVRCVRVRSHREAPDE